jgi:hypothetical protein
MNDDDIRVIRDDLDWHIRRLADIRTQHAKEIAREEEAIAQKRARLAAAEASTPANKRKQHK